SAVRDLHGTIQHEGAMKGILVTTSNFGPDSIRWAMGKPITLINGANLLHLLQKHGYQAHVDIHEAKKHLSGRNNGTFQR
ncbi:MAG: restriction endonuclease, partial [Acidobacteriaceae bacterium]|nr:restriction endonuclease [Acidobacteriaceae bacterium]